MRGVLSSFLFYFLNFVFDIRNYRDAPELESNGKLNVEFPRGMWKFYLHPYVYCRGTDLYF